jgi:hypothetical protein
MIKRLRPRYNAQELKEIYATPHSHAQFPDHVIRVERTLAIAAQMVAPDDRIGADLSCGDGEVLSRCPGLIERIYGDFATGYPISGPIERTILQIPYVDIFFLCETIEHLDDPYGALRLIREKTTKLILSTPLNEADDENPEHYWGWDREGMESILISTGFTPVFYEETELPPGLQKYRFQIWGCN